MWPRRRPRGRPRGRRSGWREVSIGYWFASHSSWTIRVSRIWLARWYRRRILRDRGVTRKRTDGEVTARSLGPQPGYSCHVGFGHHLARPRDAQRLSVHLSGCVWALVRRPIGTVALRCTVCAGYTMDDGGERRNRWPRSRLTWLGTAAASAWVFGAHVLARDCVLVLRSATLARRNRRCACQTVQRQWIAAG